MWHGCFFMSFFKGILPYNNITQRMCDEAADDSLAALKLIPDWFVTSKTIKGFKLLCMQEMVYSFSMKIMVMSHFVVVKCLLVV